MSSVDQKRDFLNWYMYHHLPQRKELKWLFDYVLKREDMLEHLSIVFEGHLCPRSIVTSTLHKDQRPFKFYKQHMVTTDIDKAFHDIRLHKDEVLYFEPIFPNYRQSIELAKVLDENPYLPDDYYLTSSDYEVLDDWLDEISLEQLISQIDRALDRHDVEQFQKLTAELNKRRSNRSTTD